MLLRLAAFFRRIRVSGVNVGIPGVGGVSVGLAEPERKAIRDLLVFLEGRRVLRVSYADEDREFAVRSVLEIREELTRTLQRLPESSPATESVRQLRRACEEFLTVYARDAFWVGFFVGLGRLRGLFGSELERLSEVNRPEASARTEGRRAAEDRLSRRRGVRPTAASVGDRPSRAVAGDDSQVVGTKTPT